MFVHDTADFWLEVTMTFFFNYFFFLFFFSVITQVMFSDVLISLP